MQARSTAEAKETLTQGQRTAKRRLIKSRGPVTHKRRLIKSRGPVTQRLCRVDTALAARRDILASIPGIGITTAILLLVEMPELGGLDLRQAASLAGLTPITRQSGRWRGHSFIQGGRGHVRRALYMPAVVAQFNGPLKAKYRAMIAAGKPAKVAITAIMRKLVVLANALLRDARKWAETAP